MIGYIDEAGRLFAAARSHFRCSTYKLEVDAIRELPH